MLHVSAVHAAHAQLMMGLRRATRRRDFGRACVPVAQITRCHARAYLIFATCQDADQRQPWAYKHGAVKPQGGNCFTPSSRQEANGGALSSSGISSSGNRSGAGGLLCFLFATVGAGGRPLIHFGPSRSSLCTLSQTSQNFCLGSLTSAQSPVGQIQWDQLYRM